MDYINKLLHRASSKSPTLRPLTSESGNDTASQKSPEHAVKVQFAREFADVKTAAPSVTESLSSASSFQSLASTLSSKSSGGLCVDSLAESPAKCLDASYVNSHVPGLDDLIAACADIKITEQGETVDQPVALGDLSQDQTFTSAVDDLSIIEEILEEDSPKTTESVLNGTFEIDSCASIPSQTPLPKLEDISVPDSCSVVPVVAYEDSVIQTHGLSTNKDSFVFSTALEFQNIEGITFKTVNQEQPGADTNDPQNESNLKSDSSNVESSFNATIESQKNETAGLTSINESIDAPIEKTQNPTVLGTDESIDKERAVLSNPDPVPLEQIPQPQILNNTIPFKESLIEDNLSHSNQEPEIKSEIIPVVSPQIPKEDIKEVPEEIPASRESDSTALLSPQIPKEDVKEVPEEIPASKESDSTALVSPQIPKEDIKQVPEEIPASRTLDSTALVSPQIQKEDIKEVPEEIPASRTLDSTAIVSLQIQKEDIKEVPEEIPSSRTLDSTALVSPQIPKEDIKEVPEEISASRALDSNVAIIPEVIESQVSENVLKNTESGEGTPKDLNPNSKKRPRSHSPLRSPIPQSILDKVAQQQKSLDATFELDFDEIQVDVKRPCSRASDHGEDLENNLSLSSVIGNSSQEVLNATVAITSEDESLSTSGQIPKEQEIAITSLPEVESTKEKPLDSTVNISDASSGQIVPEIKVFSPEKSFEDSTLKNSKVESNSLNSAVKKEIQEPSPVKVLENNSQSELPYSEPPQSFFGHCKVNETTKEITEDNKSIVKLEELETSLEEASGPYELNSTVILENSEIDLEESQTTAVPVNSTPETEYDTFKPQQQSTELVLGDPSIFEKVELEAQAIAKEIYNKSLEIVDDHEQFVSATSELFQDPSSFDFLLNQGSANNPTRDLRFESLYVKFDPLVNRSMLPQGNTQTEDEKQNGKIEAPVPSVDSPKRNPAIDAIDRLLFFSPISTRNKTTEAKDIKQEAAEIPPQDLAPVVDEKMTKELELVRSLVVQLEEKLEKVEKERNDDSKKHQLEIKKHQEEYAKLEQKNNRLEAQLAQEVESKKQVTVVLDEYERSISRLVAERERDRADLEEKSKMKEELQAASQHLSNTEAAFNDVHQKYERLKGVVAAYKSNEAVLKESVQENVETIKALENRYEQLKSHAMAQLEKANHELDTIRKHNEGETVKLQAMLRKTELKCNSLADLVEQKTKENKELTQILDEVIARVGSQNTD